MTVSVNCVICNKKLPNPKFSQSTCNNLDCKFKYQKYLVLKLRQENAKDYKEAKIKKIKEAKTVK